MHRLSKVFFLSSILGAAIVGNGFAALAVVSLLHENAMLAILLAIPAVLATLYGCAVGMMLWYEAWSSIQDGKARTTPGAAVGFMFIPVFNLYWAFQAVWGFAKDYNAYVRRHSIAAKPLSEQFFLLLTITLLVTVLVAVVPSGSATGVAGTILGIFQIVVGIFQIVLYLVAVNALCNAVNALPGAEPVPFTLPIRFIKTAAGAALILIIAFSGISIAQNLGARLKLDVTDEGLYTLSDGTKSILGKLNQPVKAKLYYAKTAALKAPDQIRYFNNYYEFVKALLEEYVAASKGMVELEIIDPRPFSDDEEQALRNGLQRFPITQEESFFFGLVVQTQFGVEKVIPFFSPDRHNFVEYDISYLIDTAITKQKKRIGVMSSLPVMGQDTSDYMAQMMRMQGQQPQPPWTFVEQLRNKYEVTTVATDANDINDVDILIVVHPKDLPEKTQFVIDQYVLNGGRTIVLVDPHCMADRPQRNPMQMTQQDQGSNLERLLRTWGLEMPENTYSGDRALAVEAAVSRNQRAEKIIGYLLLTPKCFNKDSVITTDLNQVRMLFAGVLREVDLKTGQAKPADANQPEDKKSDESPQIQRTPLVMTTDHGNAWKVSSPFEIMFPDPAKLMSNFRDGTTPVNMGYLVSGRFKSSFPEGIEVEIKESDPNDPNGTITVKKYLTGLAEAAEDCAVVVFSDVDFISDQMAYSPTFFGAKAVVGDNSALLMNTIEDLSGSGDLISIRSRGNFKRPFVVVDEIEQEAEKETADEVSLVNAQIEGFNAELQNLVASAKEQGQQELLGDTIVQKKRDLEANIRKAERQLREIKAKRRERTDELGNRLEMINMTAVPGVIMVVAVVLGVWRGARRRHYISHASDA